MFESLLITKDLAEYKFFTEEIRQAAAIALGSTVGLVVIVILYLMGEFDPSPTRIKESDHEDCNSDHSGDSSNNIYYIGFTKTD